MKLAARLLVAGLPQTSGQRRVVAQAFEGRLERAEKLLEIQKKVSEILGVPLEGSEEGESA